MYTGGSPRQNIIIKFSKLEERILKAVRKKPTNQPNKQKPNNTWRDPSWPDCWLFSRNLSEWEVVGWDFPKTKRQKLVGWKTAHSKAVPQVWRRDRQLRTNNSWENLLLPQLSYKKCWRCFFKLEERDADVKTRYRRKDNVSSTIQNMARNVLWRVVLYGCFLSCFFLLLSS